MIGLMGAFELVAGKTPIEKFDSDLGVGTICRDYLVGSGLVLRAVGDAIVAAPPLTLSREEADEIIEKTWKALDLTQAAIS